MAPACGVGPGLMYFSTQRPGQTCGCSTASRAVGCGAWFLEWSIDPARALRGVALGRGRCAFGRRRGLPGAIRAPLRAAQRAASPKKALRLRFNLTGWSSRAPSLDVLPGSRVAVLEGYSPRGIKTQTCAFFAGPRLIVGPRAASLWPHALGRGSGVLRLAPIGRALPPRAAIMPPG